MRSLLDISFIIALIDPEHIFHNRAHDWWAANHEAGWASSALTENGVIRILSTPIYGQNARFTPDELATTLRDFTHNTDHQFWPEDISLLDMEIFDTTLILGPKQITDIYLLALAVKNRGRLTTFDQSISVSAVRKAKSENLIIVGQF